jgi:hypothetical protein
MKERVEKSPVAEFLEDVVGAHALRHLRKLTPYGIFGSSASEFQTLFIFKVLPDSKIFKKNINQYSFN